MLPILYTHKNEQAPEQNHFEPLWYLKDISMFLYMHIGFDVEGRYIAVVHL